MTAFVWTDRDARRHELGSPARIEAEARQRLAGSTSAGSPAEGSQDSGDSDPLDELDARTEQAQAERQRAVSDGGRNSDGNGERTW